MCDTERFDLKKDPGFKTIPVAEAIGTVLAHDITEIRKGQFKGTAFKKGHIVREHDVCHLKRLGKESLFVLDIAEDEVHEDDAAYALANALKGEGIALGGEPREGKINLLATTDGLLKVNKNALLKFNMLGDVMCATLHTDTLVSKGQVVAGTRAIPLVLKKNIIEEAIRRSTANGRAGVISVKQLRKPRAGIVITGNEVYYGRIKDAFAPIISQKVLSLGGEIAGIYYSPDDPAFIEKRLRELLDSGADLLITTGGMSVDPDDVTRFAIRRLGVSELHYGSAVLPGAMILAAYLTAGNGDGRKAHVRARIPVIGIPACGMYHKITVFDFILPRILAGEHIGRKELAEFGHGGLCLNCTECRYPICPFGK